VRYHRSAEPSALPKPDFKRDCRFFRYCDCEQGYYATSAKPRGPPTADTKAYEPVDAHTAWPAGAWMEGSLEEGLSDILFRIVGLWRPALLYHGQSAQCRRVQTHCHTHRAVDTARKYEVHHAGRAASDRVAASDAGDRFAWRASVRRHSVFWIQGKCLG